MIRRSVVLIVNASRWHHERPKQNIVVYFYGDWCGCDPSVGWGVKRVYMTAVEFIEKVGIGAAKAQVGLVLELHPKHKFDLHNVEMFGCNVDFFELQRAITDMESVGGGV